MAMEKDWISWNLDENGRCTIEGQGRIPHCGRSYPPAPWEEKKDQITELRIAEGITEVGMRCFAECTSLKRVFLPQSLQRLHAYAFWHCTQLSEVETNGRECTYIYDGRYKGTSAPIRFGVDAFRGTPWSREKWGDFYIRGDALYAVFVDEAKALAIPEGVCVLKSFSLCRLRVDTLTFPKTLEEIGDFAFLDTVVKEKITFPEALCRLSPYALADCSLLIGTSDFLMQRKKEGWGLPKEERKRVPSFQNTYGLSLRADPACSGFRRLRLTRRKLKRETPDGLASYVLNDSIDVGELVYRRIRSGRVLLCITCESGRVVSVKSFAWHQRYNLPCEYLMYPCYDEEDGLLPWNDSMTYMEDEDILYAFDTVDGARLSETGDLRALSPKVQEEWYWSSDRGNFGGPLEFDLLEKWMAAHPGVLVDSDEENMENDELRIFVSV